jgi:alkanesulfonate monooxygenase SsuD/methylene tetrahydromethanopterin reductase-like flavin-dependent oxidoreductase (luciferase family)
MNVRNNMKVGLTLSNRGVMFGVTTPAEMLQMAEIADRSGGFQSVWVGDSLLGKPRMESIALLAGVAARTQHVRIGPACMASFPLRDPVLLAYQWASLDLLSGGRTVLVACTGIVPQEGAKVEGQLYNVEPKDRAGRLVEWIALIKRLWTEDNVTFEGKHYRCENITIEPKPAAKPRPPIWIATNAHGDPKAIERTHRRVARHADGYQTTVFVEQDVAGRIADIRAKAAEEGRDPASIETHSYHNINVNDNKQAALEESKRFLETYYPGEDFPMDEVAGWTATGSPRECAEHLLRYRDAGFDEITIRPTSWDQLGQLRRIIDEVLPLMA